MGMTLIDGNSPSHCLPPSQMAPFGPSQAPEWLLLPWHWGSSRIPPNAWSQSLAAKGKERLGQSTGAHTGSQSHFILAPHAAGWRLSWLLPRSHPYTLLHARLSFPPPTTCIRGLISAPPQPFFFSPQSDSNSWCIYLG